MTEAKLAEIIKEYRVPFHILKHMKKVAAVALFLGKKLKDEGAEIDLIFLRQAALLHDFVKIADFPKINLDYFEEKPSAEDLKVWQNIIDQWHSIKHCYAAFEILKAKNEIALGTIIKKHRFISLIDPVADERPNTLEEKILYYADKRVRHDQIVTITERLEDGQKRYFTDGNIPKTDALVEKSLFLLEKDLLEKAKLKTSDINEKTINIYLEK
ncbi:MAG: HD domain-containing protein [Candidatus Gracilibacteria bacterium]|jgi:HD superfamily phosphohydrolase YqeK